MLFNLFNRNKEKSEKKEDNYLTLRIRETVQETPDTMTVYFEQPEPFLDYQPGQYLTLILEIDGKQVRRSYSLCTSPYVDPFPGITVKRLEGGLVSNYVIDNFFPGKRITIMKPLGNFVTTYHSENQQVYGMIAGGSGITPIMGILKSILVNEPQARVHLLYCSRSREMIIFREALEDLQSKYPGRLMINHHLSQSGSSPDKVSCRLNEEQVKRFYRENFISYQQNQKFFVCGPEGLMNISLSALDSLEVPRDIVLTESFYLEKKNESAQIDPEDIVSRPVKIILGGEEYAFDVGPKKTILEAGLDEGLDMPYSCQSGLCTACMGKLIAGEVVMNEDAGLSKQEIQDGYILCCSSKPKGEDVVIQIE
ncbi:ring-1,2-phenylacetyl-CoA epoxidase subunit PaaE [Cyclobacterium lianum]|uniref:Ring-1,2-phenylacetyl-CoA epoxidase subunit PaaE n=1 Tax=Cyclobacterium lianum TaxID=388280 RepID=A0A1M7NFB1_9BACT|nr:ferredoxin--NADP reductase [Cyclobacterium lianum]SHN02466.1 ring-1,2-phenylacetyl-CoA epoxidase subunit PaaE [Cyclobacterium lianum]